MAILAEKVRFQLILSSTYTYVKITIMFNGFLVMVLVYLFIYLLKGDIVEIT